MKQKVPGPGPEVHPAPPTQAETSHFNTVGNKNKSTKINLTLILGSMNMFPKLLRRFSLKLSVFLFIPPTDPNLKVPVPAGWF